MQRVTLISSAWFVVTALVKHLRQVISGERHLPGDPGGVKHQPTNAQGLPPIRCYVDPREIYLA